MIHTASKRLMMAYMVLRGQYDGEIDALGSLQQAYQQRDSMQKAATVAQKRAEYWYQLWFQMGREFEAGQNLLMEKIDELRQRCGDWDGKPFLHGLAEKGFHDKFVVPATHPAAGITGYEDVLIEVPPSPAPACPA